MEVRCGKCNKLFRVSDDKITARGVKFSCTRCGEYVRITREQFESYCLARSAAPVLDTFPAQTKPAIETGPKTEPLATGAEPGIAEVAGAGPKTTDPSSTEIPDFLQERQEPPSPVPDSLKESPPLMEQPPLKEPLAPSVPVEEAMGTEPVKEPEVAGEPEPQPEAVVAADPKPEPVTEQESEPKPEPTPEAAVEPKPELAGNKGPDAALKSGGVPEGTPVQAPSGVPETLAVSGAETAPIAMAKPPAGAVSTVSSGSGPEQQAASKKEPDHAAMAMSPKPAIVATPSRPVRSGRMFLVIVTAAIVLALAGLGVYLYVRSSPRAPQASGSGIGEGLQIINTAGSLDANGDLVISGVLENLTNQERADWYVVVDVFDGQGKTLNTLRMLNGRQIYTKRDYEILAQRGENVEQLKEKVLQPRGIVLPPKWRASFEIRYLQPPDGVTSFNAALQPFDRAALLKEIEAETE